LSNENSQLQVEWGIGIPPDDVADVELDLIEAHLGSLLRELLVSVEQEQE
jgi:hypothetical protein